MRGELSDGFVIVRDQTDGNHLYGKGNYGYPRSGGGVDLDLLEACLLTELGKLDVFDGKKKLSFEDMFRLSSELIDG
ncbi:MAG: tRNA-intron lyase, partial [Candidatus Methanomethylophilaceae archaeon]|nr:tRNA-intron lyase [Candidatus Methanomethylophilaceae archaeon]